MNENALEWPLTRRQVLAAGSATAASFLVGCGSRGHDAAGWSFVDDRKQTVRLSKRPTRIVAYTSAAAALHQWGVTPVGVFGNSPREDAVLAGFPWGESEIVGSVYGEIDVAKLLALRAELIVSRWYPPPVDSPLFGFKDLAQQKRIGSRVPIVGFDGHAIATKQIDRFGDLVRDLGSDTMAGATGRARAAFLESRGELVRDRETQVEPANHRRLGGPEHDVRSKAVRTATSLSTCAAACHSSRRRRRTSTGTGSVGTRPPSTRRTGSSTTRGQSRCRSGRQRQIPAFAALPAVRANQVARWRADPPPSYQAYTEAMNDLATAIAGWRRVT